MLYRLSLGVWLFGQLDKINYDLRFYIEYKTNSIIEGKLRTLQWYIFRIIGGICYLNTERKQQEIRKRGKACHWRFVLCELMQALVKIPWLE